MNRHPQIEDELLQDALLTQVARNVYYATAFVAEKKLPQESLPTAADTARVLGIALDKVKKKLRVLKEAGLVVPIGLTPKRYRFDTYHFNKLPEDAPLRQVIFKDAIEA